MSGCELAHRLDSLAGARLGFLCNKKTNNEALMNAVAGEIREHEPTSRARKWKKSSVYRAVSKRMMSEIVESCDALVAGPGD